MKIAYTALPLILASFASSATECRDPIGDCDRFGYLQSKNSPDTGFCDAECRRPSQPPDRPSLVCQLGDNKKTIECEVWPQGTGFTYTWSSSGPVRLVNGAQSFTSTVPYQEFTCSSIVLSGRPPLATNSSALATVAISSPFGVRSYAMFSVDCKL